MSSWASTLHAAAVAVHALSSRLLGGVSPQLAADVAAHTTELRSLNTRLAHIEGQLHTILKFLFREAAEEAKRHGNPEIR